MLADLDPGVEVLRCCQCTRDQAQRLGFIQETYRPLPLLFIGNRQAGTDDNLAEAIAIARFIDGSLRFHSKSVYSKFEHPAIAWNVVVKQLASAAIKRSSGVHLPSRPPNSGGAVKWIALGAESDLAMPAWPHVHQATTWCLCSFSIQYSGSCLRFPKRRGCYSANRF